MSRVLLVSANVAADPFPVYPLGMAVVARAFAGRGHVVRQFDFLAADRSGEALEREAREFAPDFVGVSIRNIDNVDSTAPDAGWWLGEARSIVAVLRRSTPAKIFLGGPAFSILPEEILAFVGADHGVVGEGERAGPELVEALARGETMPAVFRGGEEPVAPSEFLAPLLESDLVTFYAAKSGMLNYQTKRGCPHRCAYCTYPGLEGSRFRARDPRQVGDDLGRMVREHGIREFFFTDSVVNDARGHYLEVAEELVRRSLGITWYGYFRPQNLGREELRLLKLSGLGAMELGTDAACDATLAAMEKGFTFAEAEAAHRACVAERLPCAHFVMFGGPGETDATVEDGLANLARLDHTVVFAFSGVRILPKSPLHGRAVREGVIDRKAALLKPLFYHSPGIDRDAMDARIRAAFRGKRDRIFPASAGQERLKVMHKFGHRGLLWDQLIRFPKEKAVPSGEG